MKLKVILWMAVLSILVGGCGATSSTMESWIGADLEEVILAWGPPDKSIALNTGKTVVTWSQYCAGVSNVDQTFIISETGKIEGWSAHRLGAGCGQTTKRTER